MEISCTRIYSTWTFWIEHIHIQFINYGRLPSVSRAETQIIRKLSVSILTSCVNYDNEFKLFSVSHLSTCRASFFCGKKHYLSISITWSLEFEHDACLSGRSEIIWCLNRNETILFRILNWTKTKIMWHDKPNHKNYLVFPLSIFILPNPIQFI